ncbi:MAG: spore coat assemly protein [Bacillota bacterium]|jgi:spore coat assembly protein|nr:spore coat assemly protein [Bacillota bacterium]MDK2883110.1 spore coat assemly protein [Bacillota bacterium]MDK2960326.1 spore coat assemly protein [Bacillota bacterium]
MYAIQKGDIVARRSYQGDVFFKVMEVLFEGDRAVAILKGLDVRLLADAPLSDLRKVEPAELREYKEKLLKRNAECFRRISERQSLVRAQILKGAAENGGEENFFELPGKVLHLDGDPDYLDFCLSAYKQLGVIAAGKEVPEEEQPKHVAELIREHSPDILILTGHDALVKGARDYNDPRSYRNSRYFIEAVKNARRVIPSRDELVIFAGACQSNFEAIIAAGANYASSPKRVLIHCLDPVFIAEEVAFTPISKLVSLPELVASTITGKDGIGGIETRGKFRLGFPKAR